MVGGSSEEFSVLLNCFLMKPSRSFASDNNATVHPEVLEAIRRANYGHVVGYGDDPHPESAAGKHPDQARDAAIRLFFVNGSGATHQNRLEQSPPRSPDPR